MSTPALSVNDPAVGRPAPRGGSVTQLRVLQSEWTKLWSLRSTRWSLLAAIAALTGLSVLIAAFQMKDWTQLSLRERATYDSIDAAVNGYRLAQLAVGVLGVLVISGEYSTGMIRSSFMAVPRRLPVLWAKLIVYCGVTFVLMLASSLVSFFLVQAIVNGHHQQHALGDPHALRVVVGAALFLTALGALAVGLGALLRNTAGAIAAFFLLLLVLPPIVNHLPSSIADDVGPYLPMAAGSAVASSTFDPGPHLSPWTGFAVLCGYAAVAIAAAAIAMRRRDA